MNIYTFHLSSFVNGFDPDLLTKEIKNDKTIAARVTRIDRTGSVIKIVFERELFFWETDPLQNLIVKHSSLRQLAK